MRGSVRDGGVESCTAATGVTPLHNPEWPRVALRAMGERAHQPGRPGRECSPRLYTPIARSVARDATSTLALPRVALLQPHVSTP
jgi:hypothetical protein